MFLDNMFTNSGEMATTTTSQTVIQSGASEAFFGQATSMSGDGTTVACYDKNGTVSNDSGRIRIYTNSGSWVMQTAITLATPVAYDQFGLSVALSYDGNTCIIGCPRNGGGRTNAAGNAYVYKRTGTTWALQGTLVASDSVVGNGFGYGVTISSDGNTAAVGAHRVTAGVTLAGAVYIFTRSGSTWTQQQKVIASDPASGAQLGMYVSLSKTTGNDLAVGGTSTAVYIYTRSGSTWTQQQKIVASADINKYVHMSYDGNMCVIGSLSETVGGNVEQGAAYVYTRSGSTWSLQQKITIADGVTYDGLTTRNAMCLNSAADVLMLGAATTSASIAGKVYFWTRSGSTWTQQQKITDPDNVTGGSFGSSVCMGALPDLAGAYVYVIPSPGGGDNSNPPLGRVHFYSKVTI